MKLQEYRQSRLRAATKQNGFDLLVASLPANISYLSGYKSIGQDVLHRTQAYAAYVPAQNRVIYIMSVAEIPSIVEHAGADAEIFCFGGFRFSGVANDPLYTLTEAHRTKAYPTPEAALAEAIRTLGAKRVGLDESWPSQPLWEKIAALCPQSELIAGAEALMQARLVKHPDEVAGLERAAEIAEEALTEALAAFHIGMTEHDLEVLYRAAVCRRDADPFFYVGTAAKRCAYSDTTNTTLAIGVGDMIRFDFGCIYQGYCSDLARTAIVGDGEQKILDYYEAVRQGTHQAIAAIKPGVIAEEIFAIAVNATRQNGIPHYERHHCGHGIGVEVYDAPSIAPGVKTPLEEGMTFCIETPYYELGWGGVQIENTIVVTKDGCRYLDKTGDAIIRLKV